MKYDFDKVVDRHGTNCLKYDFAIERGKPADILPLWVADMDFQTAPAILERLEETVKHGIFGYSDGKEGYFAAVQNWYRERFGWETKPEWLVKTPGVVFALAAAVRAYTKEGDGVLLQQPVYYPFSEVITDNGRKIVNSPLKITDGYYTMDFDDLETKIVENKVKLFLLCSPHNPVGRVWSEEELRRVGEICLRHGVLVVSDEIHTCRFYPTATDSVDLIQNNIPVEGLHNIIISSEPERVLCHILAAGRRHHDEGRVVLHLRVVFYFFHDGNSVQSRHDHIHENNIRIRADDHVVRVLAIIRLPNYMDPILFFQNFAK